MNHFDSKAASVFVRICLLLAIILSTPLLIRIFIADSFIIRGNSMYPTLHDGEKVWVNKLIIGPRIYTTFDFSTPVLKCFRLPGIRKVRVGDIAIINYPSGWIDGKINFKINNINCKRCSGCPGDTVSVIDCHLINSRTGNIPGYCFPNEKILRNEPDSLMLLHKCLMSGQFAGKDSVWTIKNMGPLYVPAKGDIIPLTAETIGIYAMVIEYETGRQISAMTEYKFKEDYYFFTGDFMADSKDSRYIGFVPQKFIIGIVGNRKNTE